MGADSRKCDVSDATPASSGRLLFWALTATAVTFVATVVIYAVAASLGSWSFAPDAQALGVFGDYIGGVVGTIVGSVSLLLLYRTLAITSAQGRQTSRLALLAETARVIERRATALKARMDDKRPGVEWFENASPSSHDTPSLQYAAHVIGRGERSATNAFEMAAFVAATELAELADLLNEYDALAGARTRFADSYRVSHGAMAQSLYVSGHLPGSVMSAYSFAHGPLASATLDHLHELEQTRIRAAVAASANRGVVE